MSGVRFGLRAAVALALAVGPLGVAGEGQGVPGSITFFSARDGNNGRHIVFHSFRDGNFELYLMDSDGGDLTRLTNHPGASSRTGRPTARRSPSGATPTSTCSTSPVATRAASPTRRR